MPIERVVINASPLIVLFKSQLADLLPQLFTEILVPKAIWDEVVIDSISDVASEQLPLVPWALRVEVSVIAPEILQWNLGSGESEVLSYALNHPGVRAMVDDAAARRCARTLSIPTLGTGGALVLAKRRGLIPTVSASIQALRNAGLWLSDDLVRLLKQQAGEET